MTLFFYLSRRFLFSFLAVFVALTLFYALLDMIDVARRFASADLALPQIVTLTLLRTTEGVYQMLPFIVLLATIALFLALARGSELVVVRAAGRSAMRLLLAPVAMAFGIGILAITTFNPMVAATKAQYERLSNRYLDGSESILSVSREGLWLRQGSDEGQTVIRAVGSNLDATELKQVSFYGFLANGEPGYRIEAAVARLENGDWALTDYRRWRIADEASFDPEPQTGATLKLPSTLTAEQIRDGFGTPSSVSFWDLPAFISQLQQAGFSARRHLVWFQSELSRPLLLVASVLIGATLTMRQERFGRTGLMVVAALLFGFAFFFVRNFGQILGENGQLPVYLAVWAVPVAVIMLCVALILHLEDG